MGSSSNLGASYSSNNASSTFQFKSTNPASKPFSATSSNNFTTRKI